MFSLNSIRRVPDDSPIFQFCINGDLQNVKELVYDGTASAFDVDRNGWSPLHVSFSSLPELNNNNRLVCLSICTCGFMSDLIRDLNADVYLTDNANLWVLLWFLLTFMPQSDLQQILVLQPTP